MTRKISEKPGCTEFLNEQPGAGCLSVCMPLGDDLMTFIIWETATVKGEAIILTVEWQDRLLELLTEAKERRNEQAGTKP